MRAVLEQPRNPAAVLLARPRWRVERGRSRQLGSLQQVADRPADAAVRPRRQSPVESAITGRDQEMADPRLWHADPVQREPPGRRRVAELLQCCGTSIHDAPAIAANSADVLDANDRGLKQARDTSDSEIEVIARIVVARVVVQCRVSLAWWAGYQQLRRREKPKKPSLGVKRRLRQATDELGEIDGSQLWVVGLKGAAEDFESVLIVVDGQRQTSRTPCPHRALDRSDSQSTAAGEEIDDGDVSVVRRCDRPILPTEKTLILVDDVVDTFTWKRPRGMRIDTRQRALKHRSPTGVHGWTCRVRFGIPICAQ